MENLEEKLKTIEVLTQLLRKEITLHNNSTTYALGWEDGEAKELKNKILELTRQINV